MNDNLDTFLDNLQEEIFDDAKEAFGEAGFERWRNPKYNGRMENFDTSACIKGECGDTMEMFLKFDGNCVKCASYITDGCASSTICGSITAEMSIGKDPDELTEITGDAVLKKIDRFPEEDRHCAFLASETLQEALRCYMMNGSKKK
ncbi:MAG: iron-sulfur cluster assembly scaffold protein [Desulfobacterales bacterium]|jgi:nitrogen fixation protein NifU and related proteins|nr:iron-sulfur cluster assembly scaffold protein [Desulfobacteraceae bacterium]MBT4365132.1 iron-sulfur cluster assembly scaffold protein [Desulfobacteraceae bacterium]MBT7698371.1 iron-sulfur cluster assembly scaffold protein [Desulfobacterales bacterium]